MKVDVVLEKTVEEIHKFSKDGLLKANPEYQRSLVWSQHQQKMFIDSLLRGYNAPAFYFHVKKTHVFRDQYNINLEIIDGQQRVNAIVKYLEGAFELLDPSDENSFHFPNFVKDSPSPWAGKRFDDLDKEIKDDLLKHKIVSYEITTDDENEIRDLFIRLQAGTPLSPQDKRDAWPGKFTDFILTVGGKSDVDKYYGLPFFNNVAKVQNESSRRQLAAQTYMLFHYLRENKKFCDLRSKNIDLFYHQHIDFSKDSNNCREFLKICDILNDEMSNHPKLVGHHCIHLILLVDALKRNYPNGWQGKIAKTLYIFKKRCDEASKANKDGDDDHEHRRYYTRYLQWTSTSSNNPNNIRDRHVFFAQEMIKLLGITPRDPKRLFNDTEREIIFYRDQEKCQHCLLMDGEVHPVAWENAEIHHVLPHSEGGETEIENGALVHKECHPKAPSAVNQFRERWDEKLSKSSAERESRKRQKQRELPPDGTLIRANYKGAEFTGQIIDKMIILDHNKSTFDSLSSAGYEATQRSTNGWDFWEIKTPDSDQWELATHWRHSQNN